MKSHKERSRYNVSECDVGSLTLAIRCLELEHRFLPLLAAGTQAHPSVAEGFPLSVKAAVPQLLSHPTFPPSLARLFLPPSPTLAQVKMK